ncbi:hypothetical protein CDD83_7591 [Cordyceps sp. RAO-2017]|nr:hypothetical protein CDD83_7591 [Cordyceps sp. RAO-2017]
MGSVGSRPLAKTGQGLSPPHGMVPRCNDQGRATLARPPPWQLESCVCDAGTPASRLSRGPGSRGRTASGFEKAASVLTEAARDGAAESWPWPTSLARVVPCFPDRGAGRGRADLEVPRSLVQPTEPWQPVASIVGRGARRSGNTSERHVATGRRPIAAGDEGRVVVGRRGCRAESADGPLLVAIAQAVFFFDVASRGPAPMRCTCEGSCSRFRGRGRPRKREREDRQPRQDDEGSWSAPWPACCQSSRAARRELCPGRAGTATLVRTFSRRADAVCLVLSLSPTPLPGRLP